MCFCVDMLSRLKISALETTRDFAKLRYKNHLDAYIQAYLGKPLEKLSVNSFGFESCQTVILMFYFV